MQAVFRHCYIAALACALASLAYFTGPSTAQQLFPADIFPMFRGLGEREVPPPGQRSLLKRPANTATIRPSFDCRRAKLAAEAAICSQSDLAALDRAMAESYKMALLASPGNRAALKAQQKRYIARRNACGGSADCLRQAMMDQIARLDPAAGPNPDPGIADTEQAPDVSTPSADGQPMIAASSISEPVACEPPPRDGRHFVCTNAGLIELDARMASAVVAILGSGTTPRDFEASQRAWMARRDECANDVCLQDVYAKRLADIAEFMPATAANDLGSPEVMHITRGVAAAWGLPMLRGRLYLPQTDISRLYRSVNDPSAINAWRRFLLAAGLAAEPDLIPQYNEDSLVFIACNMLDEATISELSGDKICFNASLHASNSNEPGQYLQTGEAGRVLHGSEFAIHDFAQSFKARYLSKIVSSGPKPPFEIVIVVPAGVSDYDLTSGKFHVSPAHDEDERYRVLGSSTDLVLKKLVWPASEKEARAFVARREESRGAFIAIPMTVKGAVAATMSSQNGLPTGFGWDIEAGDAALYDDARLTTRLYAFPAQARLPVITADTGGAVKLYGDVPLNDETMMLVLLKNGVLTPDRIKWENAAQNRYDVEQVLSRRPDWRSIDPWGLWFTDRPNSRPDMVARFKDWTLRRVAALPDKVVLRQDRYFAAAPGGLRALGQVRGYGTSDTTAIVESLATGGGGLANLLEAEFRIQADVAPILAAAPLPSDAYILPAAVPTSDEAAVMETVLQLGRVEVIGRTPLVHVTPLSASLRKGDQIVSKVAFPPPADQVNAADQQAQTAAKARQAALDEEAAKLASAEAAKNEEAARAAADRKAADGAVRTAAAAYLAGEVSGPDIVGVRLGMSVDEADATLRKALTVGWVLENADDRTNFDALDHLRIYVSADRSESVALLLPHDDQPPIVIGVERVVQVAPTVPDAGIQKLLHDKYGAPSSVSNDNRTWVWGSKELDQGYCGINLAMSHNMRIISGPPIEGNAPLLRVASLSMRTPAGGPNVTDLANWTHCRPAVSVTRGSDYVYAALWDMRALVTVASSQVGSTGTADDEPVIPAIKF